MLHCLLIKFGLFSAVFGIPEKNPLFNWLNGSSGHKNSLQFNHFMPIGITTLNLKGIILSIKKE